MPRSPSPQEEPFESIANEALDRISGGSSHTKNSEVTAALTAIQGSLKDLASSRNSNQTDPMQMILMMMLIGGGGGGGGGYVAAPAPAAAPPVINVDTGVYGGGGFYPIRRGGKKGW